VNLKEMFQVRPKDDHVEVAFLDMERAEEIVTVRFFPVANNGGMPNIQVNIGLFNVPPPGEEWDFQEVACQVREAVTSILETAWRKYEADH
jgi:hypothetical protein